MVPTESLRLKRTLTDTEKGRRIPPVQTKFIIADRERKRKHICSRSKSKRGIQIAMEELIKGLPEPTLQNFLERLWDGMCRYQIFFTLPSSLTYKKESVAICKSLKTSTTIQTGLELSDCRFKFAAGKGLSPAKFWRRVTINGSETIDSELG